MSVYYSIDFRISIFLAEVFTFYIAIVVLVKLIYNVVSHMTSNLIIFTNFFLCDLIEVCVDKSISWMKAEFYSS